jgi:putative transposase
MSNHRKIWTPEQKLEILNYKKEKGSTLASREFGVSTVTIHNWEKKFEELGNSGLAKGAKTAIELELQKALRENRELKQMVADKELALRVKDALLKKSQSRNQTK